MGGATFHMWRALTGAGVATLLLAGCAGGPRPGDTGYAYNVNGRYTGLLVADSEPFDATLELSTGRGGRVRGSFTVPAPLEIEGDVEGVVIDDLLRVTLLYDAGGDGSTADCPGRIEGVLTISPGAEAVNGPVTITDCVDQLVGRLSFRRSSGAAAPSG
ncbi:MAG: hypothetical protein PVF90_07935 [Gemmatimonadota bacterium]